MNSDDHNPDEAPLPGLPAEPATRDLCLRCRRPRAVCWCAALVPVDSRTRVVFLQHPREARVGVSTCRMAHLSLPNSTMHVLWSADQSPALAAELAEPDTYILFPAADAVDISALPRPPHTLVVVDGTWSNAKKIVQRSALLRSLPRVAFHPDFTSNYRIRREPAEHCLSTIEATAHALERLEAAPGRYTPMLAAFERMVDMQLEFRAQNPGVSRHKKLRPPRPKPDLLAPLRAAWPHLVVFYVEDLPPIADPAAPPEPTFLLAVRPATGERFLANIAAHQPPVARALAQDAWRAFLGDLPVLGGWGYNGVNRLRSVHPGWAQGPLLDLRALRRDVFRIRHTLPTGLAHADQRINILTAVAHELHAADPFAGLTSNLAPR
jgi:DTW domain-containing protein YfiP